MHQRGASCPLTGQATPCVAPYEWLCKGWAPARTPIVTLIGRSRSLSRTIGMIIAVTIGG